MQLTSIRPRREAVVTPLRYPGGKSRLTGFLRRVIVAGGWNKKVYAEPFAGGAGAAVALMLDGTVERIAVNDLDRAIYAFWWCLKNEGPNFISAFDRVSVDLETWYEMREVYRARESSDLFELGFATFFLNRTNRSGVLTGGVIGGLRQQGTDLIDARFNRSELRRKICAIVDRAGDLEVHNLDASVFVQDVVSDAFLYADPPYVRKGSSLYLNHFDESEHRAFAGVLEDLGEDATWVVTYDDEPLVRSIYAGRFQGTFELPYSAHTAAQGHERLVASRKVEGVLRELESSARGGS